MMSFSRWEALDQALDHALDLETPERDAFLATLDAELRGALEPLLRHALREDSVLDHPEALLDSLCPAGGFGGDERIAEGTWVGPYQIEVLVGEGGMGRVFRAHRADGAFDQTVAVKVVRTTLALAGSDVGARFQRERDVLASLDHPGIARLLDGGETEDGVPYLVTEFIEGADITAWAAHRHLDVKARVRLLMEVARAVDHAHRRFVVHRDLKPSNVLVTERDGAARPVVLDFGIAKLLDAAGSDAASRSFATGTGHRPLTPAYAAPELFEPGAAVTTAADVYGLGALLYELLTDRLPHGPGAVGPPRAEVTRPSKAVTLQASAAPPVASSDPAPRARALRGDLDTICLKALHPDPARRYASAAALAEDLARYLEGHPVHARPDALLYVASRFARRHRTAVAAAGVALFSLVIGLSVALVALRNEQAARVEAEVATARATEAADLLAGLFQNARPVQRGQPATLRDVLDEGLKRIAAVESDSLRAYLLGVLGTTFVTHSDLQRGDSLLAASLALYGTGASGERVSELRIHYAATRDGFADHETALALGRRVYADLASGAPSGLTIRALRVISRAHLALGQPRQALEQARAAVALARKPPLHAYLPQALSTLARAVSAQGDYDSAIRIHQEAVLGYESVYGPDDTVTSGARAALAEALTDAGRFSQAESVLRQLEAYQIRVFGPSVSLSYTLAQIGRVKLGQGQYREAAAALDSAVAMGRAFLPPDHPDGWHWLTLLATASNQSGAYARAEGAAREALARAEAASDAGGAGRALLQLGEALNHLGRQAEARAALQRAAAARATPAAASEPRGAGQAVSVVRGPARSRPQTRLPGSL